MTEQNRTTDVPPCSPEELASLLSAGLLATSHVTDYNQAQAQFVAHIEGKRDGRDEVVWGTLLLRAILGWQVLADHDKRLVAEQLVIRSSVSGGAHMTSGLLRAVARAPCRVRFKAGSIKLIFEISELVRLGRKLDREGPTAVLKGASGERDMNLGPAGTKLVSGLLDRLSGEESLGERLGAELQADFWLPSAADFPHYEKLMESRAKALSAIPESNRALYTAPARGPKSQELRALSNVLSIMPKALRLSAAKMMGVGPWSVYELLDQVAGWDYDKYWSVVSTDGKHAAVPCANYCFPAFYVAKHGTRGQLATVLDLYPAAADTYDASGRPLIVDVIRLADSAQKVEDLLAAGADPNASLPTGLSTMRAALETGNYAAAGHLLTFGYEPDDDSSIDQTVVDRALESSRVTGPLRVELFELRGMVPETSQFSEMAEGIDHVPNSRRGH